MTSEEIMAVGRVAERLLIVLSATASIWMGWNLFKTGILKKQEAEIRAGDVIIKFRDVAPGTFYTFFGAAILVAALSRNLLIQNDATTSAQEATKGGKTASYLAGGYAQNNDKLLKALNTLHAIDAGNTWDSSHSLKPALETLNHLRSDLLRKKFPRYWEYLKAKERAHSNPPDHKALSNFDQPLIDSISQAEQETYP